MKQNILIIAILFLNSFSLFSQAPNWSWLKSYGGKEDDYVSKITTDLSGNIIIAGYFKSDSIAFDTNIITNYSDSLLSHNSYDGFVAKFDTSGNVLWIKKFGGKKDDVPCDISTDAKGNLYITGSFNSDSIKFGGTTLYNAGSEDIFITKYDASGNVIWAISTGSSNSDYSNSITTDSKCNFYITGNFRSDSINFGNTTLYNSDTTGYSSDIFIAKYDSTGKIIWAKKLDGCCENYIIKTDTMDNLYISGNFNSKSINFDSIVIQNTNQGTTSTYDIFVAKYDSSGNALWAKRAGSSRNEMNPNMTIDIVGNVYISGYWGYSITFDNITLYNNGNTDNFIAKYNSSGNVIWAKRVGGTDHEFGLSSMTSDIFCNIYISGTTPSNTINLGNISLPNTDSIFSYYYNNWPYLAKYDSSGNALWAKEAGLYILTEPTGNIIYLTGYFAGDSITFEGNTLISKGGDDIFIAKLHNPNNAVAEIENKNSVIVFPNPTNSSFTIKLPQNTKFITITNSLGQIVEKRNVNNQTEQNFEIKNNGMYFVQITTDKEIITKKIIVNK